MQESWKQFHKQLVNMVAGGIMKIQVMPGWEMDLCVPINVYKDGELTTDLPREVEEIILNKLGFEERINE